MIVKLRTEHHLEFLSLKGGCTGSSESTRVYTCQNATLLEISCTGSILLLLTLCVCVCVGWGVFDSCFVMYCNHLAEGDMLSRCLCSVSTLPCHWLVFVL